MALEQAPTLDITHQDFHRAYRKLALAMLIRNLDDLLNPYERPRALHWLGVEIQDPESLWHHWLFDDFGLLPQHIEAKVRHQLKKKLTRYTSVMPGSFKVLQDGDGE